MRGKKKFLGVLLSAIMVLQNVLPVFAQEMDGAELKPETKIVSEAENARVVALSAVTNLKAVAAGKNKVQLNWDKVLGAEDYIIYRRTGNGNFAYRYITSDLSFMDTTASGTEYNFYRVYPCYYKADGSRVVGPSGDYVYAKATLGAAENLKAEPVGINRVKLTWNKVNGADGYIIYRRVGNGAFTYRQMTGNLTCVDTTASDTEQNFYRVYPYYKENGKNVLGTSKTYVYSKGVLPAVKGLKSQVVGKSIKLTWNKLSGAEGYIIYRREGDGTFEYLYMKDASATSFTDTKCSGAVYNFYRVFAYHTNAEKRIVGASGNYVYGGLVLDSVTELVAASTDYKEITLRWTKPRGAEGYYIFRIVGDPDMVQEEDAELIGEVNGGNITKYVDTDASITEYNSYAVMPYFIDGQGQTIIGDIVTAATEVAIDVQIPTVTQRITGYESYTNAYQVLDIVNRERKNAGLKPLAMDKDLMAAAMQRAAEITVDFSHTRPSGLSCFTAEVKAWGENIAMGTYPGYGASDIMKGWMNSPGHRANILDSEYTSIGIGCFRYNGCAYWVQMFGINMLEKVSKPADRTITRTVKVATGRNAIDTYAYSEEDGINKEVVSAETENLIEIFSKAYQQKN